MPGDLQAMFSSVESASLPVFIWIFGSSGVYVIPLILAFTNFQKFSYSSETKAKNSKQHM